MSATPSIDAYDAQMLDFSSDPDVPMHITGSAEFFAEALMDHDDHLAASTYSEHASVEVDMEEYVGDNAEYEMADETAEYHRSHGDDLLDIEVYDASHVPSPLVSPQPLQPPLDLPIDSEHPEATSPAFSERVTVPELPVGPGADVPPAALEHSAADATHVEPSAPEEGVSSETVSELAHPTDPPAEGVVATSESHEQLGETAHAIGQTVETPASADLNEAEPRIPPVTGDPFTDSEVAQLESSEPSTAESAPLAAAEEAYDSGPPTEAEKAVDPAPVTEGEAVDPLHISDGVYIDPPPAVLLSIVDASEPAFTLFNQPEAEGEFTEETHGEQKSYSLLLENRPTLYYEPLISVFEALRQDEGLLSRVPYSSEGELILDAYDLQLAISEDNIHSREISLHDLNILHDGSDFVGPLRLLLRATVPRFIVRYYAVQEQIQRLNVAAETGEERSEEHHNRYDEQPQHEEETGYPSAHGTVVSESLKVPPTVEAEDQAAQEPAPATEPSEEPSQDNYEPEDVSALQGPVAEYHEVTGEVAHALEDEDDYEGTNAGDEDESSKSDHPDADQIHETVAEDADAAATVTGHGSEFGGEQTEYLDYVQPEEYDAQYGEDLPEQAGGASPVRYGEPVHYEEEGEQNTSTTVDEPLVILPGSDDDDDNKTAATPIPAHAVLEPESTQLDDNNVINEPVSDGQVNSISSGEGLVARESTGEVHVALTSSNYETSTAQAKIFSEVESDSNFVSLLEREADAEFERTFNPKQSGQESSIETALQQDEAWDEWDDEDAEGEDEEDWIDPDAVSNESSITLSSKASKRSYDELDPSEDLYDENPQSSPGSKRPRVE